MTQQQSSSIYTMWTSVIARQKRCTLRRNCCHRDPSRKYLYWGITSKGNNFLYTCTNTTRHHYHHQKLFHSAGTTRIFSNENKIYQIVSNQLYHHHHYYYHSSRTVGNSNYSRLNYTTPTKRSIWTSLFGTMFQSNVQQLEKENDASHNPILECFSNRYKIIKDTTTNTTTDTNTTLLNLSSNNDDDRSDNNNNIIDYNKIMLLKFSKLRLSHIDDALRILLSLQRKEVSAHKNLTPSSSTSQSTIHPIVTSLINTMIDKHIAPQQSLSNVTVAMNLLLHKADRNTFYNDDHHHIDKNNVHSHDSVDNSLEKSNDYDESLPITLLKLIDDNTVNNSSNQQLLVSDILIQRFQKNQQQQKLLGNRILCWSIKKLLQEQYNDPTVEQVLYEQQQQQHVSMKAHQKYENTDVNKESKDIEQRHTSLKDALDTIEETFCDSVIKYNSLLEQGGPNTSASKVERTRTMLNNKYLSNMYQYLGIQNELISAQYKMYHNVGVDDTDDEKKPIVSIGHHYTRVQENVLQFDDIQNIQYIETLLKNISNHLVPMIEQIDGGRSKKRLAERNLGSALKGLLSSATGGDSSTLTSSSSKLSSSSPLVTLHMKQLNHDRKNMIVLHEYVTLDGALQVLFRLSKDLFDINIVEETDPIIYRTSCWKDTVRLFHVYKNDNHTSSTQPQYIGSFYIDPYKEDHGDDINNANGTMSKKSDQTFTMPLLTCGTNPTVRPVIVASFQFNEPYWKGDPTFLSWDDCTLLFHEFGHIYQYLLVSTIESSSSTTTTTAAEMNPYYLSPNYMPYDFTEFLPKLMEHWLYEKSTIYALIGMSNTKKAYMDDQIESAYRIHSLEKAQYLVLSAYISAMELYLLTKYNVKNHTNETLLSIQKRFALEYLPSSLVPYDDDITSLLEIFQDNSATTTTTTTGSHNSSRKKATMYRYIWCDCLAATIFQKIKHEYEHNVQQVSKQKQHDRLKNEKDENNNTNKEEEVVVRPEPTIESSASSSDPTLDPLYNVRTRLQQYLLEPGAAIDINEFVNSFQIDSKFVTHDALLERYRLVQWNDNDNFEKDADVTK